MQAKCPTCGQVICSRIESDADFDKCYESYPLHKGRKDALKAWNQTANVRPTLSELLSDIANRKANDPQWTKDGGRFIPYPATYLRGKRWEDDLRPVDSKKAELDALLEIRRQKLKQTEGI
jgi:hypothetical protein